MISTYAKYNQHIRLLFLICADIPKEVGVHFLQRQFFNAWTRSYTINLNFIFTFIGNLVERLAPIFWAAKNLNYLTSDHIWMRAVEWLYALLKFLANKECWSKVRSKIKYRILVNMEYVVLIVKDVIMNWLLNELNVHKK